MNTTDEVRKRILDEATTRMLRYGIKRLTMDEVASALGVSKKTIYQHFRSKDELVREAVDEFLAGIAAEQEKSMAESRTPFEYAQALMFPLYRSLLRIDRMFFDDLQRFHPEIWKRIDEFRSKRLELLAGTLRQGIESGVFRNVEPELAINLFKTAIQNFMQPSNLSSLNITPKDALKFIITTLFLGLVNDDMRETVKEMMNFERMEF